MTVPETAGSSGLHRMRAVLAVEDVEQASGFYEKPGFWQEIALRGADGRWELSVPVLSPTCGVPS